MNSRTRPARRRSGVGTGTTSLLMIFTVLCFATLAMLSLSTAASNDRIQRRGIDGQRQLVEAKGAAAIEVANLDETLLQIQQELAAQDDSAYFARAFAAAAQRGWVVDEAAGTITMHSPINDSSRLVTQLVLLPPGGAARYEVASQVSELSNGWAPEEGGQLWIPE